jgi:hypothetical protein
MNQPQIVFFDTEDSILKRLEVHSAGIPYLSFFVGNGLEATKTAKLDAMQVSLMIAIDRFGVGPPFPVHEAIVIKTPEGEVKGGLPEHVIAGVAIAKDDPKDPQFALPVMLSAILRAVREFNLKHEKKIMRVGILTLALCLDKLPAAEAVGTISRIYREIFPE